MIHLMDKILIQGIEMRDPIDAHFILLYPLIHIDQPVGDRTPILTSWSNSSCKSFAWNLAMGCTLYLCGEMHLLVSR